MYKGEADTLLQKFNAKFDNLARYTTFGIGGKALIVFPSCEDELAKCIIYLRHHDIKFKVIGNGSNILAPSNGTDVVIVCTKKMRPDIVASGQNITVASGVNINQFILWCADRGFSGLENLFGIPATVGGMVVMNAGAFGTSIFDKIKNITLLSGEEVKNISATDIKTGEHWSELLCCGKIVLSVTFKLDNDSQENIRNRISQIMLSRSKKQPTGCSAGSVFRNTSIAPAGKLIDEAGLKGFKVGGAYVSEKHANFIISEGASDKQVKELINIVQRKVFEK